MPRLSHDRLIRISKADCKLIGNWKEGVDLNANSASGLAAAINKVPSDRLRLAYEYRRDANVFFSRSRLYCRSALSRYYYSMYHAMRACVFANTGGDDHESHSELPLKVPRDFDDFQRWKNQLKSAREYRNRADYDPYPASSNRMWHEAASELRRDANALLPLAGEYLKRIGGRL